MKHFSGKAGTRQVLCASLFVFRSVSKLCDDEVERKAGFNNPAIICLPQLSRAAGVCGEKM